jgi:hypothetical protein
MIDTVVKDKEIAIALASVSETFRNRDHLHKIPHT